jgi:hypothetical protein
MTETATAEPLKRPFDYNALDPETRIVVQQRTSEIKSLMKRNAQDIVEIGQKLIEIKLRLGHGNWGDWLAGEFDWNQFTAERFMNVARTFGNNPQIVDFAPSALYLLAAPSTPEAVREEAIALAQAGETITYSKATELKQKSAPKPPNFSKEEEVKVVDPTSPYYQQTVKVVEPKGAVVECEVETFEGIKPYSFLADELEAPKTSAVSTPSKPKPAKPTATIDQLQTENAQLRSLLGHIIEAVGEHLPADLLAETQELLG